MATLILGASGATGRLLVEQMLRRGHLVRIVVRSVENLSGDVAGHANLSVIQASVPDLGDAEMAELVRGCDAVACCLGHRLTFKGVFGPPRRLVTDATRRACGAVRANESGKPIKFVLMNTTGNRNRDLRETISFGQKCVIRLLRLLLPPHADNEQAAEFLRAEIGQNDAAIEWVAVRPDGLVDEPEVTRYSVHPSPTRSAIFDAGVTSRINVARFMAELITDADVWNEWKGRMPVIYNTEPEPVRSENP